MQRMIPSIPDQHIDNFLKCLKTATNKLRKGGLKNPTMFYPFIHMIATASYETSALNKLMTEYEPTQWTVVYNLREIETMCKAREENKKFDLNLVQSKMTLRSFPTVVMYLE